jgi:hypothetical protein
MNELSQFFNSYYRLTYTTMTLNSQAASANRMERRGGGCTANVYDPAAQYMPDQPSGLTITCCSKWPNGRYGTQTTPRNQMPAPDYWPQWQQPTNYAPLITKVGEEQTQSVRIGDARHRATCICATPSGTDTDNARRGGATTGRQRHSLDLCLRRGKVAATGTWYRL